MNDVKTTISEPTFTTSYVTQPNSYYTSYIDPCTTIISGVQNICFKKKQEPKVVFDGDYTIYHNEYGEKTVVKRMESEQYDKEKAVMYAILKSKGIKPKDITELIENSADNKVAREKRKAKKLKAKEEKQC